MYDRSFKYVWGKFINYERKGNFNEYTGTFVLTALTCLGCNRLYSSELQISLKL